MKFPKKSFDKKLKLEGLIGKSLIPFVFFFCFYCRGQSLRFTFGLSIGFVGHESVTF